MLEIWRQEGVYSFGFWPQAVVKPPRKLVFAMENARVTVHHMREGEWLFESAREVVEAREQRIAARIADDLPLVTSGVQSVAGCAGETWSSTVGLANVGAIGHVIGRDMGAGLVATLDAEYRSPPLFEPSIKKVEAVARRIERRDIAKLAPREDELKYVLGPLQILAPKVWPVSRIVDAQLKGEETQWVALHHLTFEFSDEADAPSDWLETSAYVEGTLLVDGVVAEGEPAHCRFAGGTASANAWAALPPPDDDDPYDVDTEAVAVLRWHDGTTCKVSAIQEIPYAVFERRQALVRLRDLVLRIAASSRRQPR